MYAVTYKISNHVQICSKDVSKKFWVNFFGDIPEDKLNPKHENIFG